MGFLLPVCVQLVFLLIWWGVGGPEREIRLKIELSNISNCVMLSLPLQTEVKCETWI